MIPEDENSHYDDFLAGIDRMTEQAKGEERFLEGISKHCGSEESEELGPLGERVKKIREEKGLTLADVSSRTGIDQSYLKLIESEEVSPPLGILIKLGKALGMKMGFFISGGATCAYTVVRKEEQKKISRRAATEDKSYGYTYQALAPGKKDRHMEPFLVTLDPSKEKKLSSHDGQEFIYVLEGRMEAIIGDESVVLEEGDSIYYDSNVPHQVRSVEGSTRILAVLYAYDK